MKYALDASLALKWAVWEALDLFTDHPESAS